MLRPIVYLLAFLLIGSPLAGNHRLVMILDEGGDETLRDTTIRHNTSCLNTLIKSACTPVLTTKSVFMNFIARRGYTSHPKHTENLCLQLTNFTQEGWEIFEVLNSQYFLLVPKKYTESKLSQKTSALGAQLAALGFQPSSLMNISHLLPAVGDYYKPLRTYLAQAKGKLLLGDLNLHNLFCMSEEAGSFWNIIILGHGSAITSYTAGAELESIHNFFTFLHTSIPTNLVHIISCSSGGTKKFQLLPRDEQGFSGWNFALSIGNLSSAAIFTMPEIIGWADFFTTAEIAPASEENIGNTLMHLTPLISHKYDSHGIHNIPQVIFPHAKKFKVFSPHAIIATPDSLPASVSGTSLLSSKQAPILSSQQKPAVCLFQKTNVLEPLRVTAVEHKHLICAPEIFTLHTHFPTADIMAQHWSIKKHMQSSLHGHVKKNYPAWHRLIDLVRSQKKTWDLDSALKTILPSKVLYPAFLSINYEDPRLPIPPPTPKNSPGFHYLSSVSVSNIDPVSGLENQFLGVLRFIRDAFFDIATHTSPSTFHIDELRGCNDISLTLEIVSINKGFSAPHPLAEELTRHDHKNIALHNVVIRTMGMPGLALGEISVFIEFELADTAWFLIFKGNPENFYASTQWNFLKKTADSI